MKNLYSRLFRYKSRQDREPLEDFLSEAIADLLSRMPAGEVLGFLHHAFEQSDAASITSDLAGKRLEWRTQEVIPGGIIDLALFVEGKPRLVIENKTWSDFQDHSTEEEQANQLHTYCRWLAAECPADLSHGILLITGTATAPPGYHGGDAYPIDRRAQITWAGVGRWLSARLSDTMSAGETWRDLAFELVAFIKEKKLSSEVFVASDVSAAHLFLPTKERWSATFEAIWQGGQPIWEGFLNTRIGDLNFRSDGGIIWHWRYSQLPHPSTKTWVGLAVRFPDQSEWYQEVNLPATPHFLFILGSDKGELLSSAILPDEWIRSEEDGHYLLARELSTFGSRPDQRLEQLQKWSRSAMRDAQVILRDCQIS